MKKEYIKPETLTIELAGKEILQVGSPGSSTPKVYMLEDEEAEEEYGIL